MSQTGETTPTDVSSVRADMARQALQNDPEISIVDLIGLLVDSAGVKRTERALWRNDQSILCSVDADVIRDTDVDRNNPEDVTSLYLRDEGVVILDFDGRL